MNISGKKLRDFMPFVRPVSQTCRGWFRGTFVFQRISRSVLFVAYIDLIFVSVKNHPSLQFHRLRERSVFKCERLGDEDELLGKLVAAVAVLDRIDYFLFQKLLGLFSLDEFFRSAGKVVFFGPFGECDEVRNDYADVEGAAVTVDHRVLYVVV